MFETVINKLLEGAVVCPVTDARSYDYLANGNGLEDANEFLARIGRRIISPANGGAFYLVYTDPNAVKRPEMKTLHTRIMTETRPVLDFLELCMQAMHRDDMLSAGDAVQAIEIGKEIDNDSKLRSDLREIVTQLRGKSGETDRERLEVVLSRMEQWGYLKLENAERQIYRVTGMIDVFQDHVAFFIENAPGGKEFVQEVEQEGLLL